MQSVNISRRFLISLRFILNDNFIGVVWKRRQLTAANCLLFPMTYKSPVIPRVYSKYFLHSCRYDNIHSMTVLRIVHRCLFPSMVPEDLASRHGTSFKKECPISSISFPIGLPGVFFLLN